MHRTIKARPAPFTDSRERVAEILTAACGRLSPAGRGGVAAPSIETVRSVLERATTTRVTRAVRERVAPVNRWRFLKAPRKYDDVGRVFLHRLQWHTGTGSAGLWTLYGDAWLVGDTTFQTLDTIAAVFVQLFTRDGLNHTHNEKWNALLLKGA
ncbi:MAG: hypothetical protein ACYST6_10575 [Planctomycetota bacterium]|jgi:hypothetical protein